MPIIFSYLLLLGSALLLAGIGVLISFLGEKACLSKQCIGQANFIHRSMNKREYEPCDDFYSFVCNKFPKYGYTIFDDIQINSLRLLISYLEVPADWETDTRIENMAKTLFQNCVNETQLESEGLRPLERVLKRNGGVPFLDPQWDYERKAEFGVVKVEMTQFYNGLNSIFVYNRVIKMKSYPSIPKNDSREDVKKLLYSVYSVPPHLYRTEAPDVDNYYKYCIEISDVYSKALKTNKTLTDKEKHMIKQAGIFKKKLLKLLDSTRNCSDQPFEFIKTTKLIKMAFGNFPDTSEIESTSLYDYARRKALPGTFVENYLLVTPHFLKYAEELQKIIYATPLRVIATYMGVEMVIQLTPYLPRKFRELYSRYLKPERDQFNKVLEVRQFHCAKLVKDAMTVSLSTLYLRKNPKPVPETAVFNALVYHVSKALKHILKQVKWASKRDKQKMLQIVNTVKVVSPLPKEIIELLFDNRAFEKAYLTMCMSEDSTLESYLSVRAVRMLKNCGALVEEPVQYFVYNDDFDIFDIDIYYHRENNSIVVPMAYLFYPSLDGLWPKYLTYGGLAVWLAHTIIKTVSYDNVLYYPQRDPKSDVPVNLDWWEEGTISRYEQKRHCALHEYNHYLKPFRVKSNDANCLEDTLYYSAAVQAAYYAYKEVTKLRFFVEPRIPFFTKYSVDQIFFIKYASSFCQYEGTSKLYRKNIDTAIVSSNFTVLYSLRNFPKFQEVFKCEGTDKMSKKKPCDLWPTIEDQYG